MTNIINFESVTINKFLSIGNITNFPLSNKGVYLIAGKNLDDPRSESNGSGKSAMLESIIWCLYGKLPRFEKRAGLSDDVVNDSYGKDCYVNLLLRTDSHEYSITRYRKHKQFGDGVIITEDGQPITRHANKKEFGNDDLIMDIIKTPYEVFVSTIIMGQGMNSRFSLLDDSEKKALIEGLREWEYSLWSKCQSSSALDLNELDKRLKELQSEISIKNGNVSFLSNRVAQLQIDLSALSQETTSLMVNDVETVNLAKIDTLIKKKAFLENKIHIIDEESEKLKLEITNVESMSQEDQQNIGAYRSEVQRKRLILQSPIKKCSSCGTVLSSLSDTQLKEMQDEYQELTDKLEEQLKVVNKQSSELENRRATYQNYNEAKLSVTREMGTVEREVSSLTADITNFNQRKSSINTIIATKDSELNNLQSSIAKLHLEVKTLNDEKSTLDDRRPFLFALARESFGPRGLRAFLIARDINDINKRLLKYSKLLFTDRVVYLKAGIEDGVVSRISLETREGSEDRKYSKLSQGEKRRADIAVQFSIYDFIRSHFKVHFNFLVLDEIFENLDSGGITMTMKLINAFVDQLMCVFVISHNPIIKSMIKDSFTVIKENNVSRLLI